MQAATKAIEDIPHPRFLTDGTLTEMHQLILKDKLSSNPDLGFFLSLAKSKVICKPGDYVINLSLLAPLSHNTLCGLK